MAPWPFYFQISWRFPNFDASDVADPLTEESDTAT
jgi:hypothetical protein